MKNEISSEKRDLVHNVHGIAVYISNYDFVLGTKPSRELTKDGDLRERASSRISVS